jgi:hypothetical protein
MEDVLLIKESASSMDVWRLRRSMGPAIQDFWVNRAGSTVIVLVSGDGMRRRVKKARTLGWKQDLAPV